MNVPFFANRRRAVDSITTNLSAVSQLERPEVREPVGDTGGEMYIWRIVLHVMSDASQIVASVRNPVVIGRSDPATGSRPDIDLTGVAGQGNGVSRIHAIIIPTDEGLCVIDLDTPNGTAINGQKLVSGRRYRLRSGDRLELGTLKLMVSDMGIVPRGRTIHSTIVVNRRDTEE